MSRSRSSGGSSSNNNSSGNNNRKDPRRNVIKHSSTTTTSAKTWKSKLLPKTRLGILLYFFTITFLVTFVSYMILNNNVNDYGNKSIGVILQDVVAVATDIQGLVVKYKIVVATDPFASLVTEQVMPVHDKLSSLKRQLVVYEGMERIPGGPTNFMASAFKDLNYIESKIWDFEREYNLILVGMRKGLDELSDDTANIYKKLKEVSSPHTLERLKRYKIYLEPPPSSTTTKTIIVFDSVIELVAQLADLAVEWEKAKAELKKILLDQDIQEYNQILPNSPAYNLLYNMSQAQKQMESYIDSHGVFLQNTFTYFEGKLNEFKGYETQVVEVQTKFKLRYDRLTEMMVDDIANVKDRVKGLRLSSSKKKKSTEL